MGVMEFIRQGNVDSRFDELHKMTLNKINPQRQPRPFNANFLQCGCICHISLTGVPHLVFSRVDFKGEGITVFPVNGPIDGLSTNFSGCLMARFTYQNADYIAHIPNLGASSSIPHLQYWMDFLNSPNVTLRTCFIPGNALQISYIDKFQQVKYYEYWGVIDVQGNCYSIQCEQIPPAGRRLVDIFRHSLMFGTNNNNLGMMNNVFLVNNNINPNWQQQWSISIEPNIPVSIR